MPASSTASSSNRRSNASTTRTATSCFSGSPARSRSIPTAIRGDLPEGFKARLIEVLQNIDLSGIPEADRKVMGVHGTRFVPQTDAAFNDIRDLVKTLNIDLSKLNG